MTNSLLHAPLTRRQLTWVALAAFAMLVPFVAKPLHIDDPLWMWSAEQIGVDPLRPFAVVKNWYGIDQALYLHINQPPLHAYGVFLAASIFGWSEVALHVVYLVPAIALVVGVGALANRFGVNGLLTALFALATPLVFVTSTTLMADTLMGAFWIGAIFFWVRGEQEGCDRDRGVAALLACACLLTKYHGVALVPLLLAWSVFEKRRVSTSQLFLLIPLVTFVAYQFISHALYGSFPLVDAAHYAQDQRSGQGAVIRILVALSFLGGGTIPLLFLMPMLWRARFLLGWIAVAGAGAAILFSLDRFGMHPIPDGSFAKLCWSLHLSGFVMAGLHVLALLVLELWRKRDSLSLLLGLWILGVLFFSVFVNWSINGRSLLVLAPAVAILALRGLDNRLEGAIPPRTVGIVAAIVCGALVSFLVAAADQEYAAHGKHAAERIDAKVKPGSGTLWFTGHWGFQYYMEAVGHRAMNLSNTSLEKGDRLATPTDGFGAIRIKAGELVPLDVVEMPFRVPIATMNRAAGAGFHNGKTGPLPFSFGRLPPSRFRIENVARTLRFNRP